MDGRSVAAAVSQQEWLDREESKWIPQVRCSSICRAVSSLRGCAAALREREPVGAARCVGHNASLAGDGVAHTPSASATRGQCESLSQLLFWLPALAQKYRAAIGIKTGEAEVEEEEVPLMDEEAGGAAVYMNVRAPLVHTCGSPVHL